MRSPPTPRRALPPRRTPPAPSPRRRAGLSSGAWADALELFAIALRAGYLPRQALAMIAAHTYPTIERAAASVEQRCAHGERFADALAVLIAELGLIAAPLVDGVAAAERDGAPLAPLAERLAAEAQATRRRDADHRARQLPVRLSVPVAVCILPAFVLLAVAPMVIGALLSLRR